LQEEFFVNNPLNAKEYDEHALDVELHFSLGRLFLFLRVITINPALVNSDNHRPECRIVGGNLTELLAGVDTLQLLFS
jgi:hypothetical protein